MKRTFVVGVVALSLFAGAVPRLAAERFSLEVKGGYFLPTEKVFRDVYDGGGLSYGGEFDFRVSGGLSVWLGADYFKKDGKLTFTQEATTLTLKPISGGVRYSLGVGMMRPYVALGVTYVKYREESVIGSIDEGDVGFLGQVGVRLGFASRFFLDVQGRYSTCKAKPGDVTADLGGLLASLGLGVSF